ncbi:bis(5'-adenosyl)-triphosphatase-like [Actinia tenebrosa]|uniref:Bis(5'-adenosyl)-triphosphatase n=1 Tax=Actinia tenebrosa TaxID=6105 RepID=A0A6P8HKV9_ACTTE|nr:bis(5'-adenosyl)-triphosphatase-like [Actinia tenebrosa]
MAAGKAFKFGSIILSPSVVFFRSKLSFGFVNIKPVLQGHVLVSPFRVVKRFADLTEEEVSDLFISTQKISSVIQEEFNASSLTISIQDGPDAGQTIEHVHVHILPRKKGDFENNDDVYTALAEHDKPGLEKRSNGFARKGRRSEEEMAKEASKLASYFDNI